MVQYNLDFVSSEGLVLMRVKVWADDPTQALDLVWSWVSAFPEIDQVVRINYFVVQDVPVIVPG